MRVAIHQPHYLPWLGYFDKIDSADVFIFLDTVQFKKNEWQNRHRIKTAGGWQWLTVPVHYRYPQRIAEVRIDDRTAWARKHHQALATHYGPAPAYPAVTAILEGIWACPWDHLVDLNVATATRLAAWLGLGAKFHRASEFAAPEERTDRLVALCRAVGADTYLSGSQGATLMDLPRFAQAGIAVLFQDYQHPTYAQRYGPFVSHLSIVDLLCNHGAESLAILRTGRRWAPSGTSAIGGTAGSPIPPADGETVSGGHG